MKANKRVRDPRRRSDFRLFIYVGEVKVGVTTYPVNGGKKENQVLMETRRSA